MTALGRPQFLVSLRVLDARVPDVAADQLSLSQLQFSEVLVKWRRFFNFLAAQQGKSEMMVLEQKLELEQLQVRLAARDLDKFALVPPSYVLAMNSFNICHVL